MSDTREKVLDTAELLFARSGAGAVSIRAIANEAGVNLAAVNYHFHSKDRLFEEMYLRRVVPLNDRRLQMLAECLDRDLEREERLVGIVRAFVAPALDMLTHPNQAARAVVIQFLLGRILAIPQVNEMLSHYYDILRTRFVSALIDVLPSKSENAATWLYYWMGGCVMCSLAIDPSIAAKTQGGPSMPADIDALTAFIVRGAKA